MNSKNTRFTLNPTMNSTRQARKNIIEKDSKIQSSVLSAVVSFSTKVTSHFITRTCIARTVARYASTAGKCSRTHVDSTRTFWCIALARRDSSARLVGRNSITRATFCVTNAFTRTISPSGALLRIAANHLFSRTPSNSTSTSTIELNTNVITVVRSTLLRQLSRITCKSASTACRAKDPRGIGQLQNQPIASATSASFKTASENSRRESTSAFIWKKVIRLSSRTSKRPALSVKWCSRMPATTLST